MDEQVIVEIISPDGETVYCFENTGNEITKDTTVKKKFSVTEG